MITAAGLPDPTWQHMKTFDSPVGFTAGLSQDFTGGGDYAIVPYDTNILNHGDAYRYSSMNDS